MPRDMRLGNGPHSPLHCTHPQKMQNTPSLRGRPTATRLQAARMPGPGTGREIWKPPTKHLGLPTARFRCNLCAWISYDIFLCNLFPSPFYAVVSFLLLFLLSLSVSPVNRPPTWSLGRLRPPAKQHRWQGCDTSRILGRGPIGLGLHPRGKLGTIPPRLASFIEAGCLASSVSAQTVSWVFVSARRCLNPEHPEWVPGRSCRHVPTPIRYPMLVGAALPVFQGQASRKVKSGNLAEPHTKWAARVGLANRSGACQLSRSIRCDSSIDHCFLARNARARGAPVLTSLAPLPRAWRPEADKIAPKLPRHTPP